VKKLSPFIAALTIAALFVGCAGGSGVRFSDLFDDSAAAEGTGIQFTGLVRAVVILATHDASARQRKVAEENGRRAVARLQARIAESERQSSPPAKKKTPRKKQIASVPTTKPKAGQPEPKAHAKAKPTSRPIVVPETEPEPAPKRKPAKKLPRIIAVVTEKDERTDKKAAQAIMLFDTHAQKVISNKVYDIESEPRVGEAVRFETHSSNYIGASL